MKRRIFATLLAFCLVASLCVVGAAADGDVSTAAEFKTALENGGEVTLTDDITISEKMDIVVTQPVTLNLNGSTVTKTYSEINHYFIVIKNGRFPYNHSTSGRKAGSHRKLGLRYPITEWRHTDSQRRHSGGESGSN